MARDVDSRDVLDPDAMTRRAFRAQIVGHWRRKGPNPWDKYRYISLKGDEVEVLPGLKVAVERYGAMVRMRRQGKVVRVEWVPEGISGSASPREVRRHFIDKYLAPFDEEAGRGVTSVIADKLRD